MLVAQKQRLPYRQRELARQLRREMTPAERGYRVIRFANETVLKATESVLRTIVRVCAERRHARHS